MSAITIESLVAIWQATRSNNLLRLARVIKAETQIDELVKGIVLEIIRDNYKPALAWLATAILEAGHNLDEKLKWEFIRNESIRDWFEDRDDIGLGLLKAINALADVIEDDCRTVQGQDADDVAAELCLSILGGGKTPDFFRKGAGLNRPLREKRPQRQRIVPNILERLRNKDADDAEVEEADEAVVEEVVETEGVEAAEVEEIEDVAEIEEIEDVVDADSDDTAGEEAASEEDKKRRAKLPFGLKARSQ